MSQEANDILKGRSLINRHLFQKRIADAAEAQSEANLPTFYSGFDCATGRARLESIDGKKVYGKPQTNGAIAIGSSIRLTNDFYDSLPRRKPEDSPIDVNNELANTGLVILKDSSWLDIPSTINKKAFYKIIKYFLNKSKTIYTIGSDPRVHHEGGTFGVSLIYGVSPFDSYRIPINISQVFQENHIKVKLVDLNQPNIYRKVKSCFVLPLFKQEEYEFTDIEKINLRKIAQQQGLIIFSEWRPWDFYTRHVLETFDLFARIQSGASYKSVSWIKGGIRKFLLPDGAITTEAIGTFVGVSEEEKLLIINESTGLFLGDDDEYIPEGELRDISPRTPSAIYIKSKNLTNG
ncbi:MAG: hypothetical protein V7L31_21025 [Nostoc sp.]|uniref:hypothetical protein n=1 Tax=Nostoc sp. TaxID=1180 RepID=UPI002FEF9503